MEYNQWLSLINDSIGESLEKLQQAEIEDLASRIQNAKRVFLMGSGRTGLITQTFGMRLAQLDLPVFIIGQPTTPALEKDDFLILISGSGQTENLILAARKAIQIGSDLHIVTQNSDSPLGELISNQLLIPSPTQPTKVLNGTLFELSLLITLDAVINQLANLTRQSFDDMSARHANIE